MSEEEHCHQALNALRKSYESAAKPYVDRLVAITRLRMPQMFVPLAGHTAQPKREPAQQPYMHEYDLPADMSDADYSAWHAKSWVLDGFGVRVGPVFPASGEPAPVLPKLQRWLAVGAGSDTVRLIPVDAPSTGPDVFCKLQDAESAIAAAASQPKPASNPMLTPRDWQAQAQREASELLGTPEGAAKLAEAKRYGLMADALEAKPKPAPVLLTDEEVDDLARTMVKGNKSVNWLARAVESAVLRKNGIIK